VTEAFSDDAAQLAREPYLEVFGSFWDGMSFLIASANGISERLGTDGDGPRFTTSSATRALEESAIGWAGAADWPVEILLWESYAYEVVEAHALLDEYLRACFELLSLSHAVARDPDLTIPWGPEAGEHLHDIEENVHAETGRFDSLMLWNRVSRLRSRFGLGVRFSRPLEAALKKQRRIRNIIVHGQLSPHVVMPDGTIGRMKTFPPPPYVPLGPHIVRGAMSVLLEAHRVVDLAMGDLLGIPVDQPTADLMEEEIGRGRDEWFTDPWESHPEHLFDESVLVAWRPSE
jgi:hypothetical protein